MNGRKSIRILGTLTLTIAGSLANPGPSMAAVDPATGAIKPIAVGSHHTCALTTAGGVKCWGFNAPVFPLLAGLVAGLATLFRRHGATMSHRR